MNDNLIFECPYCKAEIRLTETLAAPLIAGAREKIISEERGKARLAFDEERKKLKAELEGQALLIKEKVKKVSEEKEKELSELKSREKNQLQKLEEAQRAQTEALKKSREYDDKTRELELTIEKRVMQASEELRVKAAQDSDERNRLRLMERDETIASMQRKIEELLRKAEQGSQQLQGEVLELELESMLKSQFPSDAIDPVPKGSFGADLLQAVNDHAGAGKSCGTIIWELKRTKTWSDAWLSKLRDDQRAAKAEIAVIVSLAMPKEIETFGLAEGIWVVSPKVALPVAVMLRRSLIEISKARQVSEGAKTKSEAMYEYLTGTKFIQRMSAIVEAFQSMQDDLAAEKKAISKQWAKREMQINRVMESTIGMYGDMQGIAGKSLREIEGLEFKALEGERI